MARYFDMTNTQGCIGIIPENGEQIIFTGVSINSMPISVRRKEGDAYAKFAQDYDIHFIFDDHVPKVDFYTVPRVDIAATDNAGGFIASVGQPFDLCHSVPLIYISKERRCYSITDDSTKLLSLAPCWKENLTPYDEVTLYASKAGAREVLNIEDVEQLPQYQRLMELIEAQRGNSR